MLGMGPDGHTASLFPNSWALDVDDRLMTLNSGPTVVPPDRVSMTYKLLNASRLICPLVIGTEKAPMIHKIATGDDPSHDIPIKGINPVGGVLRWYLDAAACGVAQASEEK
jgi:6-phosphogluconolactonase